MDSRILLCVLFSLLAVCHGVAINEAEAEEVSRRSTSVTGGVYTRWGRGDCPSTANKVYYGIVGGSHHSQRGSGANYLCLTEEPIYDSTSQKSLERRAEIYSVEYQSDFEPIASLENHDVPCAVCEAKERPTTLMVPGRSSCPGGWTREYDGYLMASEQCSYRTEFVCVDKHASDRSYTHGNSYNSEFFPVEGKCSKNGGLPCGPYRDGAELTCVVCSK